MAKSISSLHKFRLASGELFGIIINDDHTIKSDLYIKLLNEIINSDEPYLLKNFILTVGVVSNHGNWFSAEDHNKELKVLAQSYDWLIFLTDQGITSFLNDVILNQVNEYKAINNAFLTSYKSDNKHTQFTKVKMNSESDDQLIEYFKSNKSKIRNWFNIISPQGKSITELRQELKILQNKKWRKILK